MGSTYLQLYYHIVWTTYKRYRWIDSRIEKALESLIREKPITSKSELLAFGCTSDHVHLLVKLHPSASVSVIVGEVKGYTSYVIANHINPESGFRWQRRYGAFTVPFRDILGLTKYIHNQNEHHQQDTLSQQWEIL